MKPIQSTIVTALAALILAAAPVFAREGVEVGGNSAFTKLVPAAQVEGSAKQQYQQVLQQADQQRALVPESDPQVQRLRRIAARIIPQTYEWNPRAKEWKWEVNLLRSNQINAWCMPGGKIAFYTAILDQLHLADDEVAAVMGHEIAHALREHARKRMGKNAVTEGAARLGGAALSSIFGIDPRLTDAAARGGASLLTLKFSREDESEADLVGLELAARAGFNPQAGITLWQKMSANAGKAPAQWMSTHPSSSTRIADIEKNLPRVMPLYERARKN